MAVFAPLQQPQAQSHSYSIDMASDSPPFSLYYKVLACLGVVLCVTLAIAPAEAQFHLGVMLVLTVLLGICMRL